MSYRIFFIFFFIIISSCTNQNFNNGTVSDPIIFKTYSNNGFTLIYNDDLYKNKIVNKKLNDRDLFVYQKNLTKNTTVKITNQLNNKSVIATVKGKSKYPNFYNSVITTRIADEIELDLDEPYILIQSVDHNSVFYAGKAKTFEEEKNVADKAPVEGVNIINISSSVKNNEKVIKISKNFNYIIKIASFYYEETAKLVKERVMSETNIKNINIDKISKNNFRLSIGPYKSLDNLKTNFDKIDKLYFENLELIKLWKK